MYLPTQFEETRVEEIHKLIREFPLGMLVTNGPGGLDSNPLPFEIDAGAGARGTLRAHCARANPLWREVTTGDAVLVVFHAGNAYISPNWYPSKHETHRHVPTWNYRVVQVRGRIAVHDDERHVRGIVARLTRTHEGLTGDPRPWKMADSAPEFIDSLLANIVGLEVEIESVVAKTKLGQNREDRDRLGAADALSARGEDVVSQAMRDAGKR